jgi:flagellar motor protein MotB
MSVREQDSAYKRGVVLGLTLAEVIILIVFCLLLLFAATWKMAEQTNRAGAAPESEIAQIVAELEAMRGDQKLSETWREMTRAYYAVRRPREARAASPASDEEVKRLVLAEMETMRGKATLDAYWRELRWARDEAQRKGAAAAILADQLGRVQGQLVQAASELRLARQELTRPDRRRGEHDWPPIIRLSEAERYFFRTNEAVLSGEFETRLREEAIPRILALAAEYRVNVVEVIGHTDEQRIQTGHSNLDASLLGYLSEERGAAVLQAADNAGLGMARAAAVTRFLRKDPRILDAKLIVLPLSAAQAVDATGMLADGRNAGDVRERRRIEIRLRRPERPVPN